MWPDVGIKSGPILPNFVQNVATSVFTQKVTSFKKAQKVSYFMAAIERKFVAKTFKNISIGHTDPQ